MLEPAIDTGGPMGRTVLTVLGMVAEMELGFIRDRQRAGIEAAKAKGLYKGRPVTFDRARIVSLRKEGMGATEIAKAVGCKRGNVYKAQGGRAEIRLTGASTSSSFGWFRRSCAQHGQEQSKSLIFWLTNEIAPNPSHGNSGAGGPQQPYDVWNKTTYCMRESGTMSRERGTRVPDWHSLALLAQRHKNVRRCACGAGIVPGVSKERIGSAGHVALVWPPGPK